MKLKHKFTESVSIKAPRDPRRFSESACDWPAMETLPLVAFPEIHAITSNWVTRNFTYYPEEAFMGVVSNSTGTVRGIDTFTHPYPVPIIRDHASSPMWSDLACEPYGRIYSASFVKETMGGWARVIGGITDPWAIGMLMTGRFLTVSIGVSVEEIYCSACRKNGVESNMIEEGMCPEHERGQSYEGQLCYWMMGPITAEEISFVNTPADMNARVINPSLGESDARTLLAGTDGEFLLDMQSGKQDCSESFRQSQLNISRSTYNTIIKSALDVRKRWTDWGEYYNDRGPLFQKYIENSGYLQTVKTLRRA